MDSNGHKLLIVDGSAITIDLLSHWLRVEDVQIFTADTGNNALAKLAFLPVDIVVINVELPDMSGFELCRMVKKESGDSLILCISASDSDNYRLRAEEMGADDYFQTFDEHYLFISKVRSLLRLRRLSKQLHVQYAELEAKNALIDKQLEMGMLVQRTLIPDIDMSFKHCKLLSRYYPAMGVSGDFYNVLALTPDSFGIIMGDVSGSGIAAAFIAALLNMMIKNLSMTYKEPDSLLFHLNNELYQLFENSEQLMYACVFYAVINTSARVVRYSNAGQCSPFHVDVGENTVQELELPGHPVGMFPGSVYEMKDIAYKPSDLLYLYTDGIQDIFYKNQTDHFASRMAEVLSEARHLPDMEKILDNVCNNFYDGSASAPKRMEMDDVSMILCRL